MIYCSVKGCFCYEKDGSKQRFFRFPMSFERAWLWHDFCQDPSKVPSYKRYVCDKHFMESDFVNPDLLQLKDSAIPSVNGPNKTSNFKKTDYEHIPKVSYCKRKRWDSNSKPRNSNLSFRSKYRANSSKIPKNNELAKTSPDTSILNLEKCSDFLKPPVTAIKSYKKIDSDLKNSLIESISPTIAEKRKANTNPAQRPFKIYKSIKEGLEVKLQPQIVFLDAEIEKEVNESEKRNYSFKNSQKRKTTIKDCGLKNVDITFNSTLVFESENYSITPNLLIKQKPIKSELPILKLTDSGPQTKHIFTNEDFNLRYSNPNLIKKNTKENNSKTDLVTPGSEINSRKLQKQLDIINVVHRKKLQEYRNKILNDKTVPPNLDVNDPKFSIAAIAESLGTFNSFVEEPVEQVNLKAGEWHKLYEPGEIRFPKLPEKQIVHMVNYLRNKLPTLNDRDRLEVSFLLSMMSVYPSAPEHIKKLLSQRLNLVYIATMFTWNTALALGLSVYKQTTASKGLSNQRSSAKNMLRNESFQNPNILTSSTSNPESVENCYIEQVSSKENLIKPAQRPQFAFEIILHEKSFKTEQVESCNGTTKL